MANATATPAKAQGRLDKAIVSYLDAQQHGSASSGNIHSRFLRTGLPKRTRMPFDEMLNRVGDALERLERRRLITIFRSHPHFEQHQIILTSRMLEA